MRRSSSKRVLFELRSFSCSVQVELCADFRPGSTWGSLARRARSSCSENPTQKPALVIADNKLALNPGWDEEIHRLVLRDCREPLVIRALVIGHQQQQSRAA